MIAPVNPAHPRARRLWPVALALGFLLAAVILGLILLLADLTTPNAALTARPIIIAALGLTVIGLLIGSVACYPSRNQGKPADPGGASLGASRRLTDPRLDRLDQTAERDASMSEEQTLGTLLRLALDESDTLPFLTASLDALFDAVPWLKLQPRGGVLLTQDDQQPPTLRLAATRDLGAQRIADCAAVPFGTCLCGRAAATRAAVHSDGESRGHARCLSDAQDHGHYSVPILHGDRVLGVLVLYLSLGHPRAERELQFLARVADVLSMGVTRRQTAAELRIARDAAEAGSRAKSEFLASMSHEIRTPMNGVLGMAELLAGMQLLPDQREVVETIKKSGEALLTIINDILDFSKIEAGRLDLESVPFDLGQTVHEVTQLLAARAEQQGLELILDYQPNCPRYVIGDPGRVRQVLFNLAGNAVKFTARGHVLISVRQLSQTADSTRIHLRVEDTGVGIPADTQARLFESFVQADRSTTRRFGGTGLGLAISRRLVELMGGEIGLTSAPGQGSHFWFTLPLRLAAAPAIPPPAADLTGVQALVVEDNPINQRVFQGQLRSFGMRTSVVGDPTQAIGALQAAAAAGDPFDLALLDHLMPNLDGEQLARQILADPTFAHLPLVLLTSSGQYGDSARLKQAGFAASLMKPVLAETLRQCLSGLLLPHRESPGNRALAPDLGALAPSSNLPFAERPVRYRGQVLLAEDNLINRKVALGMLRKLGVEIDTAEDGEEAVERCRAKAYDLILMDCQMPLLDGFDATRRIRALAGDHRPAIVALTANAMESDRERCLVAGMDDYISKPFRQKDLIDAFERWLPRADAQCAASGHH